ncbi:hypothetical protein [uncultured Shimia sp.]|uniref:5-carboxymethyl-2-hydroxymuconate Delta-isomerase n=1 Tax=uncultured Shimia sp. TaxID=573152 RepID=UPI002609A70F|nr:hypothetical protein [uncultured Shimia sp.]
MPHLILEHDVALAKTHDLAALSQALFDAACAHPVFASAPKAVKVRTLLFDNGRSGVSPESYAHLTIRMLTGRSTEQKKDVAEAMLAVLADQLPSIGSLSVEPVEMDRNTYTKRTL